MTKKQEIDEIIAKIPIEHLIREREFMENLYVGRFNYFLLAFSLFMTAGFANAITPNHKSVVFYVGALVLLLVWLPLYRGYKKHDKMMKIIFQGRADHPANAIEKVMQLDGYVPQYRVSLLMGVLIPWLCIAILLAFGMALTHNALS